LTKPAAAMHKRSIMAVIIGAVCLLPLSVIFTHRAIAPLLLVMGLAVATRAEPWRAGAPNFLMRPDLSKPLVRAALFFLAFGLWTGVTGLWAPYDDAIWLGLGVLTPVLAGGAVIWEILHSRPKPVKIFSKCAAVASVVAVVLLSFEAASGGALKQAAPFSDSSHNRVRDWIDLGRGSTILSIILFGALALIYDFTRSRLFAGVIYIAALAAALRFGIFSNAAGLMFGGVILAIALKKPNETIKFTGLAIVCALALAPLAVFIPVDYAGAELSGRIPDSWLHRLMVWRSAAEYALACFPFGCGADYARAIHAAGEKIVLPGSRVPLSVIPTHPHNLFLQIWLEMGLPGAVLFGAAILNGMRAIILARLSDIEKALIAGTAAVIFVSALVEISLWQVWRVSAPLYAGIFIAAFHMRRRQ